MGRSHLITYKNTKDEIELYEWVSSKSSISGFIKDLLKKEKEREELQRHRTNQGFFTIE
jgi:hypothetical protein